MPQAAMKKGALPAASVESPECQAGWLSWLLFLWVVPFAREGHRAVQEGRFSLETMPPVPAFERPESNTERFRRMWDEERRTRGPKANLVWVIFKFMRRILLVTGFITNFQALLMLSGAFCTYMMVEAIQGLQPAWCGYLMCFLLTSITAVSSVLMQLSWHLSCRAARQCWQGISGNIFAKPAHLSSTSRAHLSEGAIVNIMSVDAPLILHYMQYWAIFTTTPAYVIVPSLILPALLGWSFVVGFLTLLFAAWSSDYMSKQVKVCQGAKLRAADTRNGKLNECFQGIRTVKLNAWEKLMEARVDEPRQEELLQLRKFHLYQALQIAVSLGLPVVAVLVTFLLYVLAGGELEPARVFASVALFEFIAQGVQQIPHIFNVARQCKNNIDRMQDLLIIEDDYERAGAGGLPPGSASCRDADFRWNTRDPLAEATLRDVNLEAAPGELVAVCGRVGSGKTTLAAGLLGLVSKSKGSIAISGSTAYVTQVPQILNASIKENILFGAEMDRPWYNKVLKACCLTEDLKQWDAGDETEIGERGITISGGQKQRIATARAAYSRADVLIFDDPLSAMDAHVGKQVFDMVFRGILAGSTRIFFTNQLHFCRACHKVYMLDLGRVVEAGTYRELLSKSPLGPFGTFAQSVLGTDSNVEEEDKLDCEDVKIELEDTPDDNTEGNVEEDTSMDSGDATRKDCNGKDKQVVSCVTSMTATTGTPATPYSANGNITPAMTKQATTNTLMSTEKKAVGRIGLKSWFDIVSAAEAVTLAVYVIASCIAASLFQYACTYSLGFWTDSLLSEDRKTVANEPFDNLTPVTILIAVGCLFVASLALRGHSVAMFFLRASKALHSRMLGATLRQRMTWFDTTPVGRILNRFGNDVQHMDITLTMIFPMFAHISGKVVLMVFIAGVTAYPALIFCLFLLVISQKVYALYGAIALDIQRCQMVSLSPLVGAFSSFLTALDSIRCFNREEIFVRRFTEHQNNFIKCFYWGFSLDRAAQCLFSSLVIAAFVAVISLLMLTLSVYDVPILSALITPGTAGTVLSLNTSLAFFAPVAIYVAMRLETTSSALQRIAEYGGSAHEDDDLTGKEPPPASWPSRGEVVMDSVEMRYQPHLPLALRGVSLRVNPGEHVGIVGRTGSGKSTVILTCFRMVDCHSGSIVMDGKDVATMPVQDLRGRLGVIPQDSWLFSGTIRSNIDPFGKHSTEELWRVVQQVHLDRVAKTQDWLDTEVKEKGENLSSGTAQLLCLARVLLKRPQILFMDEATASVDSETDKLIQETIRREGVLPSGCSVITIAHRLHTVIDYDRIVVMSKGQVVEEGHPGALLEKEDGHLSQLVRDTGEASAKELRRRCGGGDYPDFSKEDAPNDATMLAGVPIVPWFGSCGPEMAERDTSQAPEGRPRGRCMPLPLFC